MDLLSATSPTILSISFSSLFFFPYDRTMDRFGSPSLFKWLPPWLKRLVSVPHNSDQFDTNSLHGISVQEERCVSPALPGYVPGIVMLPSPPPSYPFVSSRPGYLEQSFSCNETPLITRTNTRGSDGIMDELPGYACCWPINQRFVSADSYDRLSSPRNDS